MINTAFTGSTVFTIAHRINTIINSDRVMVLDKGTNVEYGPPKALAKNPKSEFSKLIAEKEQEDKKKGADAANE